MSVFALKVSVYGFRGHSQLSCQRGRRANKTRPCGLVWLTWDLGTHAATPVSEFLAHEKFTELTT